MVAVTFNAPGQQRTEKRELASLFSLLPRALDWGNRCGHQADQPDLSLRLPANGGTLGDDGVRRGGLPSILVTLMERLEQYYWKPSIIPGLNLANGSSRQQRSERREACLKILGAMVKYTDLTTLKVGIPSLTGEFQNLTVRFLAAHAGLSLDRAKRAIKDLKKAGLIVLAPLCEPDGEGGYRGLAAVKAIREEIFAIFGLIVNLKHQRKRASKRFKKKQEAARQQQEQEASKMGTLGDRARLTSLLKGLLGSEPKKALSSLQGSLGAPESAVVKRNRAMAARYTQLAKERPDLSDIEIFEIMKNEFAE